MWTLRSTPNGGNHLKILLGWSQRRRFFHHALTGSPDHNSGVQFLAANDVTLRDAGKNVSWIHRLLTGDTGWNNTSSDNGNVRRQRKTGCKDASEFWENTLRYHASQTAGQWVRGELRNMQVAGQMINDENRPKLITN